MISTYRASKIFFVAPLGVLLFFPSFLAQAGCNSAFCPVNTQWEAQGTWAKPGVRADLRQEYIDLGQPRHNAENVKVGEISGDHDEVRTRNQNWLLDLGYTFSQQWGVSIRVPYVQREHDHIHNDDGEHIPEEWDTKESTF